MWPLAALTGFSYKRIYGDFARTINSGLMAGFHCTSPMHKYDFDMQYIPGI